MRYFIVEIAEWEDRSIPRVAILRDIDSGFESKFFLFPFLDGMVAAHSVTENLSRLTGYSVLLKAEDDSKIENWTTETTLIFPF